jgi:hypothetical protein
MFTPKSRSLAVAAVLALLPAGPAVAEPPNHVHLQELFPLPEESVNEWFEQQENRFGYDVAFRSGTIVMGMPKHGTVGRVGIYTQTSPGSWGRSDTVVASDARSRDDFGRAVSFRDGLLIVGSNRAVYVYKRVNGFFQQQQQILPPPTDNIVAFRDLKHEAGILAIGAQAGDPSRDAVYIYQQDAAGQFVSRARLTLTDNPPRSGFGRSISMTSSIIVAGSNNAAYILGRNSSGTWVRRQKLVPSDTDAVNFGFSVAVERGLILVGAPGTPSPDNGQSWGGAVYGFVPGATQYLQSFRLTPNAATGLRLFNFGYSLAMFDTRVAIGASGFQSTFLIQPPAQILTYTRAGNSLQLLGATGLTPRQPGSPIHPTSLAISNDVLLIGSPHDVTCLELPLGCIGEGELYDLSSFLP